MDVARLSRRLTASAALLQASVLTPVTAELDSLRLGFEAVPAGYDIPYRHVISSLERRTGCDNLRVASLR